jgi:hypothetical protein
MPVMSPNWCGLLVLACLLPGIAAFGAGEVSRISNQAGQAFRHGDIESKALLGMAKALGHHGSEVLGGLVSAVAAGSIGQALKAVSGERMFSESDIDKIYFGEPSSTAPGILG